jgi:hypothetical protein
MLWRPHHLIRARTNFDFLGKRRIAMAAKVATTARTPLRISSSPVLGPTDSVPRSS